MRILYNTTTAIIVAIFTISVILLCDRRPAVDVLTHRFISTPPIFAGADVQVQWTIVDLRSGCEGLVHIIWIDSFGRRHPPQPDRTIHVPVHEIREGKEQVFTARRKVPDDMPPGASVYTVSVDRSCNPLQKWLLPMREKLPEVKFTVAERP